MPRRERRLRWLVLLLTYEQRIGRRPIEALMRVHQAMPLVIRKLAQLEHIGHRFTLTSFKFEREILRTVGHAPGAIHSGAL